jgi:hypothetical protein
MRTYSIGFLFLFVLVLPALSDEGVVGNDVLEDEEEQVCVTLEKYGSGCSGHVQATNTFTALTKPGSACKHTDNMKDNSAKDQYCDVNGVFHQTVYIHDKHCRVSWADKAISPMKLTYTQNKCTYGYKLKSCTPGPCQVSPDATELFEINDEDLIARIGKHLRPSQS